MSLVIGSFLMSVLATFAVKWIERTSSRWSQRARERAALGRQKREARLQRLRDDSEYRLNQVLVAGHVRISSYAALIVGNIALLAGAFALRNGVARRVGMEQSAINVALAALIAAVLGIFLGLRPATRAISLDRELQQALGGRAATRPRPSACSSMRRA